MRAGRMQIALEFILMLTFATVLFIFFFDIVATQTSLVVNQQSFTQLQLVAQNIAQQINIAVASGPGYFANSSVYSSLAAPVYSVNVTRNGVVIVGAKIGEQTEYAVAYTGARNVYSTGSFSANFITVQNYFGNICVDYSCFNATGKPAGLFVVNPGAGGIAIINVTNSKGAGMKGVLAGMQIAGGSFSTGSSWIVGYTATNGELVNSAITYTGTVPPAIVASAYAQPNGMQANLTGWWPLNLGYGPSAYDLSNSNNIGVITNASWSLPQYVGGFNSAKSSYVSEGTNGLVTVAAGRSLTAWIYFNATTYAANQIFVIHSYGAQGSDEISELRIRNGVLEFYDDPGLFTSDLQVTPNTWHEVGYSYTSSSSSITLFVDGVSQTGAISDGNPLFTLSSFDDVGAEGGTCVCNYFQGRIANVQLYRETLSANQIYSLYTEGISAPPIASSFSQYPPVVGWWPLDGNTIDMSKRVNTGVGYNGFSFVPSGLNMSGNTTSESAASFNGVSSYVRITNNAHIDTTNALTYSYWIYGYSWSTAPLIVSNHIQNYGSPISGVVTWVGTTGQLGFQLRLGNSCCQTLYSTKLMNTGQWYLVTDTWNGNTMTTYIDGTPDNSLAASGVLQINRDTFVGINADDFFNSNQLANPFNGLLADVQIYNASLPAAVILGLYQEGPDGLPLSVNSLVGWWPLNGNTNDASLSGSSAQSSNTVYSNYEYAKPTELQYSLGGAGVQFNGAGNILISGTVSSGSGSSGSADLWVNPSSLITTKENILKMNGAGGGLALNITKGVNYNLQLYMDVGGTWETVLAPNALTNPNTWYNVGAVYNGSDVNLYVDGTLLNATAATGAFTTPVYPVSIGGYSAGNYFYGSVANLQYYKTGLAANQISALYGAESLNQRTPGTTTSSGVLYSIVTNTNSGGSINTYASVPGNNMEFCAAAEGNNNNDAGQIMSNAYQYLDDNNDPATATGVQGTAWSTTYDGCYTNDDGEWAATDTAVNTNGKTYTSVYGENSGCGYGNGCNNNPVADTVTISSPATVIIEVACGDGHAGGTGTDCLSGGGGSVTGAPSGCVSKSVTADNLESVSTYVCIDVSSTFTVTASMGSGPGAPDIVVQAFVFNGII